VAVITLTTDFGTRDTYVAEMKGVILSIAGDVHVVDITHEVAPHDLLEGALALEAAAPRFPAATIHVAVVDPGVGTARRGLAVASPDQMFVGPDNGLFTPFSTAGAGSPGSFGRPSFAGPKSATPFTGATSSRRRPPTSRGASSRRGSGHP